MAKKSELSLMGQMKREAERDFHKFIKYVAELEEEKKLLEGAINELMVQCDIKYFRFRDKEFYKQEYGLNLSSKKNSFNL